MENTTITHLKKSRKVFFTQVSVSSVFKQKRKEKHFSNNKIFNKLLCGLYCFSILVSWILLSQQKIITNNSMNTRQHRLHIV